MLSLTIKDTKNFMSQLLIKEAFDGLFLSEAVIKTANSYTISGELNKDFFSEEEWNDLPEKSYSRWSSVKPFCFRLIKGPFLYENGLSAPAGTGYKAAVRQSDCTDTR